MAERVAFQLCEQPLGECFALRVVPHQQARPRGGRERSREGELGIVTASEALVSARPGEVEHEFAEGMSLDEGRRRCRETEAMRQGEVARLPAAAAAHAMRALECAEKLVACKGIGGGAQGIPVPRR